MLLACNLTHIQHNKVITNNQGHLTLWRVWGQGRRAYSLAYSLMSQAGDTLGMGARPQGFRNSADSAQLPSFGGPGGPELPRPAPELHLPGASEGHAIPISGAHDSSLGPRPNIP